MRLAKEELSPHSGHRKRMRDRFLRDGIDSLQDHEVLELLLFYAIPRQDTNELAHRLLAKFRTLSGVFDAPIEELKRVEGIGGTTAVFLKTYPEVFRRYMGDKKKECKTAVQLQGDRRVCPILSLWTDAGSDPSGSSEFFRADSVQ